MTYLFSMATKEQKRKYYYDNREKVLAQQREYRESNPERRSEIAKKSYRKHAHRYANDDKRQFQHIYYEAKTRSIDKGVPFSLTRDEFFDLMSSTHCPACYIEFSPRGGGCCQAHRSLDRIVPILGYTRENCEVLCFRCNRLKSDATSNDLRRIADFIDRMTVI